MSTNILVVDDGKAIRALICEIIKNLGYNPIPASSGEEALGLFVEHDIDLVVLDVEMPGIDGFETCRVLRTLDPSSWFPVIYLSGTSSDEYVVKGLDAGVDAYISKPVNPRVLESIIKAMGRIADMKKALRDANKELEKLANYDGLTQIFNRRGFDETLTRYWKQAEREKSELALILIDVDHFKLYNDHYGHLKGDDCLKEVASALESSLMRPIDLAARYGGEEFAILLPKTDKEGAQYVASRLLESVAKLQIPHEKSLSASTVSVSMGISCNRDSENIEALITHADEALYQSKEGGRNQFTVWTPPSN